MPISMTRSCTGLITNSLLLVTTQPLSQLPYRTSFTKREPLMKVMSSRNLMCLGKGLSLFPIRLHCSITVCHCYSSRSHRLARLFSFGLLDGPQGIAVSRNGRLTKTRPAHHLAGVHTRDAPYSASWTSPACTNVARFIHRAVRLARSPRKGRVLARLGWAGVMGALVLSRFATYS